MKYYTLDTILSDTLGVPASVGIDLKRINDYVYYRNNMTVDVFMDNTVPIYLELLKDSGTNLKLRDYHYWGSGAPNAYIIVCSEKFHYLLEKFILPPYRFYNCEISIKKKTHNYFVLHFLQNWAKVIDYSKSVFKVIPLSERQKVIKRCNPGEIKSFKNYTETIEKLVEADQYLYPAKLHFLPHINYDIWGLHGQIILSEHAKQTIENAGITGVAMPEIQELDFLRDIEIVMNNVSNVSESQIKTIKYEINSEIVSMVAEPEIKYHKRNK